MIDLRTLYITTGCVSLCLGMLQLTAFSTRRFDRWVMVWGFSSVLLGLGVLLTGLRDFLPAAVAVHAGNLATVPGYLLLLATMRMFAGKRPNWVAYGLVAAPMAPMLFGLWSDPADFAPRVALISALCAVCDLLIFRQAVKLYREEGLTSALITQGLFAVTATLYCARTFAALAGWLGEDLFATSPPLQTGLAVVASTVVALRSLSFLLMAVERSDKAWERLVFRDPVTSALNAAGLKASFERWRDAVAPSHQTLSVVSLKIEGLERVSEASGPAAAERLLQFVVAAAARHGHGDQMLARTSGGHFNLLLPSVDRSSADALVKRIRSQFELVAMRSLTTLRPTISAGIIEVSAHMPVLDLLLEQAEEARSGGETPAKRGLVTA